MSIDPDKGRLLADSVRRSGIEHMPAGDRLALREYLATREPRFRLKDVLGSADGLAESVIDKLWVILDREPDSDEYRELAVMFAWASVQLKRRRNPPRRRRPRSSKPKGRSSSDWQSL